MAFDDEPVLDHINLYINDKEFLTLLGPSGCGKTTTLRIIGGFATPTSGDVLFDGVRINDVPPYQRQINTVFQKYALFPHLNVYENIAFGLRMQRAGPGGSPPESTSSKSQIPGGGDQPAGHGDAGCGEPERVRAPQTWRRSPAGSSSGWPLPARL